MRAVYGAGTPCNAPIVGDGKIENDRWQPKWHRSIMCPIAGFLLFIL